MDKKITIIALVIVLSIGGSAVFLLSGSGNKAAQLNPSMEPQATMQRSSSPTEPNNEQPGVYIDYDPSVIAKTTGTKLLFFHAPWCPQCRALEADIKQKGVPPGVAIIKVDYDSNQPLRQKYGVMLQTTVVRIDDAGNLVKKYVAYDAPSLDSVKRHLL